MDISMPLSEILGYKVTSICLQNSHSAKVKTSPYLHLASSLMMV